MEKDILSLKRMQLEKVAEQRDHLRLQPRLRWLFFEITNRCNLRCRHCGSNCTSVGQTLSIEDVNNTLNTIQGEKPMICLTGGEPMLHPRFYEIAQSVKHLGFYWGMTTNATLIDETAAKALRRAGLSTVSVSLDGMEPSHNALRRNKGAWKQALRGLRCLQDAGFNPQVTTVVHMDWRVAISAIFVTADVSIIAIHAYFFVIRIPYIFYKRFKAGYGLLPSLHGCAKTTLHDLKKVNQPCL